MKTLKRAALAILALFAILCVILIRTRKPEDIIRIETAASSFASHSKINLFFTTVSIVTQGNTMQPLHGLNHQNFSITETYAGVTRDTTILSVKPLAGKSPVPGTEESLDVALLVDCSGSMAEDSGNGRSKLERTSEAALVLARRIFSMTNTKQARVGVLLFRTEDDKPKVDTSKDHETFHWYSDLSSIEQVLKQATPRGGTPLWDSLLQAVSITQQSKGYKSVVALTDGQDTTSATSFKDALTRIEQSNTPVFTVFYGTNHSAASSLVQLSSTSGAGREGTGSYLNADSDSLSHIFSNIGGLISDAYEIAYKPTGATAGTTVRVELRITYETKSGRRHTVKEQQQYVAQ